MSEKQGTRAAATRQRILDAATSLFLADGFSQTSLQRVAAEAGTTKPTVYSHFQSKSGLFTAVVNNCAQQRAGQILTLLQPTQAPAEDLIAFGDVFMGLVLSPDTQRWDRLAAAEGLAHPEVGEAFYDAGPARVLGMLSGYIKQQQNAGRLQKTPPQAAAELLVGMFIGIDQLRIQIGKSAPSEKRRKSRCREAVATFLARYEITK